MKTIALVTPGITAAGFSTVGISVDGRHRHRGQYLFNPAVSGHALAGQDFAALNGGSNA